MSDAPLVYTTLGNLPESDLTFFDGWEFDTTGITYYHGYKLDGEIVKRSAARFQFPSDTTNVLQGAIT